MASSQCGLQFTTQQHFAEAILINLIELKSNLKEEIFYANKYSLKLKEPFKHILGLINDGHIYSANSASGTFPLKIVRTKLIYS